MRPPAAASSLPSNMLGIALRETKSTTCCPCWRVRPSRMKRSPSGRSLAITAKTRSKSAGPRTSWDRSATPNAWAASCASLQGPAFAGLLAFQSTATRDRCGIASLRSCSRLATKSGDWVVSPVILPPGRARLETTPPPTGSIAVGKTIGMVFVALFTARAAGVVITMMMSTLSRTSSTANSGKRSA
jgi:hypothetical protein